MKKHSIKFFAFVLSLLFCLSAAAVGVSAENHTEITPTSGINDYLVAHWDFEGEDESVQLSDKAPLTASGNKHADTLIAYRSSPDALMIKDGVAFIKPDAGTYLWLNNTEFSGFDGRVIENSTIYTKFRFTGENTGFAYVMQINGIFRLFRHGNGDLQLQFYGDSIGTAKTVTGLKAVEPNTDIYFAFTTGKYNAENKTLPCSLNLSADGKTYAAVQMEVAVSEWKAGNGRSIAARDGNGLYIGNYNGRSDTGLDFAFDDIRFYNKALTTDEISQIARLDNQAPVVAGCQNRVTPTADGTQSVRLIATLASDEYTEAGYSIVIAYDRDGTKVEKTLTQKCMTVYESLTADDGGGLETITAASLGGAYLLPLTLDGIPCDREITFTVTAYSVDHAGIHCSIPVEFVFVNGAFAGAERT